MIWNQMFVFQKIYIFLNIFSLAILMKPVKYPDVYEKRGSRLKLYG